MRYGLGFEANSLSPEAIEQIQADARRARGDILTMTTLAASGHPGGSMSSIDFYMTLYACANIHPENRTAPDRDRIVVSHGHTSPGVYATLARHGFVNLEDAICGFRQAWSPFEGHIEREVPGVEWSTGNLGQGLSAGCGMALAARLTGHSFRVFVCMGDGEQQKGQIAEARRFAVKFKLVNLAVIIDYNQLQISGNIHKVMPQNIKAGWEADGWEVVVIDGHDIDQIYHALHQATQATDRPLCIIANTVMGKAVPAIENQSKYHGSTLSPQAYHDAMIVLGLEDELERYKALRPAVKARTRPVPPHRPEMRIDAGTPRTYGPDVKTDNRSAWGTALEDLGRLNAANPLSTPIAVLDCDLAESVKTGGFEHACPENFFQSGIQEHNTAVVAGALSTQGVLTFWSEFGVFGVDEVYNQQRLNDINHSELKTVCTHCGLDVGEDGKTHQSIDYLALLRNVFGYKVILPADPNETDRAVRYAATVRGNVFIGMGRSKVPVITTEDGQPVFGGDYRFEYGRAVKLRDGKDVAIFSTGTMTHRAIEAWQILKDEGIQVRVVHIPTPLEIDVDTLRDAAALGTIITYEDHHAHTGLGGIVAEGLIDAGLSAKLIRMGVTRYQPSGPASDVFAAAGLDAKSLMAKVRDAVRAGRQS